jgi:hypothetical protein
MARKDAEDTRRKDGKPEDDEEDDDDMGGDDGGDEDDYNDDELEKAAVTDASELESFIDAAVAKALPGALAKALADPNVGVAIAKAVAPELGVGRLRKSLSDFREHIDGRFDGIEESHETLSKALSEIPAATATASTDDDAAKKTPATKETPLSKAAGDDGGTEVLDKSGEKPDPKAVRGSLLVAAKRSGKVDANLLSKASVEVRNGGMSDETWAELEKACTTAGVI